MPLKLFTEKKTIQHCKNSTITDAQNLKLET